MAELANGSVVHPRNPGSNVGVDKIFSDSVCISFEFKSVGVNCLIPLGMLPQALYHNLYVERDHQKM